MKIATMTLVLALIFESCNFSSNKPENKVNIKRVLICGHAYGDPNLLDGKIDTKLLSFLQNSDQIYDHVIFTGDVVQKSTEAEWNNFNTVMNSMKLKCHIAPGNHDMGDRALFKLQNGKTNYSFVENENAFLILDNTETGWLVNDKHRKLIEKHLKNSERLFIFVHNIWWHKLSECATPNSYAGKAPDSMQNFQTEIIPWLLESDKEIYFFGGDVGAVDHSSSASLSTFKNLTFVTSGVGGRINDNVVELKINEDLVSLNFIPLYDSVDVCNYQVNF